MSSTTKENTYKMETLICETGDEVTGIAYIAEGSVRIENADGERTIDAGSFIAVKDLEDGFYSGDYYAMENSRIVTFPADSMRSFINLLAEHEDIHIAYYPQLCSLMEYLYDLYDNLYNEITFISHTFTKAHDRYLQCCEHAGIAAKEISMPRSAGLYAFNNQTFAQNYGVFLSCYRTPKKLQLLYEKNPNTFLKQQLHMLTSIHATCNDMTNYLKTTVALFISDSHECLFHLAAGLAAHAPASCPEEIMSLLTYMKDSISRIDANVKTHTGIALDIDYNRINFYFMTVSDPTGESDENIVFETPMETPSVPEETATHTDTDSPQDPASNLSATDFSGFLYTLCKYGKMDREFADRFNSLLEDYMAMSDKSSKEDNARTLRRDLNTMYFDLYEQVFLLYMTDPSPLPSVRLFLDFGMVDERLLTDGHIKYLCQISPLNECAPCKVYRMSEWLMAIYRGEKMPSKNEFDKDYVEFIREKKREEHLSAAEENKLLADSEAKVKYEINNLLKYNCRILNGNMLAFTPMLSMFDFESDLDRYELTSEKINNAINACLAIDYSAFYREQMYANPEKKIDKEVIQLQVFPDIILFPVYGINTVMWQDLSGKRSNTQGRFLFPSFYRGNLDDTVLSMIGRFRWELCKSVMGAAWNNVSIPSLTAEYSDYIQFYRKNRDLSSEKKELLKNQIARCRNNTREVFISDYLMWIKYESAGAIRLNKVSRQILATYCPFPKQMREKLTGQPIYDEAMKRFNISHQKKIHELATRMRALERAGAEITQEILDTQEYYTL